MRQIYDFEQYVPPELNEAMSAKMSLREGNCETDNSSGIGGGTFSDSDGAVGSAGAGVRACSFNSLFWIYSDICRGQCRDCSCLFI